MHPLLKLANGNHGAMQFLLALIQPDVPTRTVAKIEDANIKGPDLHVLYSDLCDRDMGRVIKLVDNCPLDVLKDACSRQDYSGRDLIAQYFN